ncbi:MAG: histidine phosphatase family protein [Ilumatobacteraceae bacterium]|nr:histidine phosphatase family protein [Ilumatobacteraceae bacterium]
MQVTVWFTEGVLYFVRHGRTEANAGGRLQGRIDLPIDEVGRAQAAALTSVVPKLDRVVCSPSLRARQTAEVFGLEPELDERWLEMDYGDFDGVPMADVPGDMWAEWISNPNFRPPGGESLQEMGDRVFAACDDLLEAARSTNIAVVSHATPIKAAMAWALGVDVTITWRSQIDQASVTKILIRDRGPALHAFNIVPLR